MISRRKRVIFALVTLLLSFVMTGGLLLAADLYLHRRAERSAGLNRWGYRGPVAAAKQPGEVRLAFLGGSTMFGYGVNWDQAIPFLVEQRLSRPDRPVSAVNLGYNNEGAYAFRYTLEDFEWLEYDVAVLYEGYNDLMGDPNAPNTSLFRHESAVFRLTGYYPILPLVLGEKAMLLRMDGNLDAGYAAMRSELPPKVVFRPDAAAIETAASVMNVLGTQLGQLKDAPPRQIVPTKAGCAYPWAEYCDAVYAAVEFVLERGKRVAVVAQPRLIDTGDRHAWQQASLAEMLARHFGDDARVRYLNLLDAVDLRDPAISYDGMHLTAAGNVQLADALTARLEPFLTP